MSKIVLALGGNALGNTAKETHAALKKTAKHIVDLVENGNEVVITHGNGPQVGMIYDALREDEMPFAESGAMSQGYIGYHIQQAVKDELNKRSIEKDVVTFVTQVEVDPKDPAFKKPTKPIGEFYTKAEADKLAKVGKGIFVDDSGRGYRKVVPSPKPLEILEIDLINDMVEKGTIVIACGGGGVPVIQTKKEGYEGVEAVIDKDLTSALLAEKIFADELLILTAVDHVSKNYGKSNEQKIKKMTVEEAEAAAAEGHFGEGSMLPKIAASAKFASTGGKAIITSLKNALKAHEGNAGTLIYSDKAVEKKKKVFSLSAFTIILLLIFVLAIVTYLLPEAKFAGEEIVNGSGVMRANLAQTLLSPIKGFSDAIDVCVFVLILGGFLKIVDDTHAIEDGIAVLIKNLKGKEVILIPILMTIFSVAGSTYGMLEETVGFYALLAATMVVAGMDTVVSSAIVLLGAGSGVLGSTVNPFAVGVAVDAAKSTLPEGVVINQGVIIGLGVVLWLTTLAISIAFVMAYARKVIKDKGSTFLSLQEQKNMLSEYGGDSSKIEKAHLNGKQKITLWLFAFTFLVMIISFIPWADFGITFFEKAKGINFEWLAGLPLGEWYFVESTLWFTVMSVVIGAVNGMGEAKFVDAFIDGADDMVGVVLIIALARGASVLMSETYLDNYIIYNAAEALKIFPKMLFVPLNYLLHVVLSILVPSSSGLATLSTPIMAPLAHKINYNVEVVIMEMVAANGLVNLITPTCGAIMGGLALAKVEYTTWFKWAFKIILTIAIVNIAIFMVAMAIL